ncbi:MAG: FAD-dependent oxidoreductase [Spirochaetales bacterium]|nr:FAD-dependent oxidoreductase [Spirochaetales bacterium]
MSKFLIVGAGISGISAAEILARKGHYVEIIESTGAIGGKVNGYACKATDSCSRCGVCIANTSLAGAIRNSRIRTRTSATINKVINNHSLDVWIEQKNPQIDYSKCSFCDSCVNSCPVGCITKTTRGEFTQYIFDHEKCLLHKGKACSQCLENCPSGAVEINGAVSDMKISAAAALIAIGHENYDARNKVRLGYGRLENVFTGSDVEEILSHQDYLYRSGEDVAFIQCVGSRDPEAGRNFCSSVCCSYALRLARVLKYRNKDTKITIYYIDIQNFDKTFTAFRNELEGMGIDFVRGIPFSVERGRTGKLKVLVPDGGAVSSAEHDALVLSTGIAPARNSDRIADLFHLDSDESGFLSSPEKNIFVTGTCSKPLSILDSMTAAGEAVRFISGCGYGEAEIPEITPHETAFEVRDIPLRRDVLVIGAGPAGICTASALKLMGYPVTLIDKNNIKPEEDLAGVDFITGSELVSLDGSVGNFIADIKTPRGIMNFNFGVIVAATGTENNGNTVSKKGNIVSLDRLGEAVSARKRRREASAVAIVLDLEIDETRASTETALKTALEIQERERYQVFIFCKDMRVASPELERLYQSSRDSGVTIIKYSGRLSVEDDGSGVIIEFDDPYLNRRVVVQCIIAGISPGGIPQKADPALMKLLGITGDCYGQIQENNVHLFPAGTNRPGVFALGSCRGEHFGPQILLDAGAAARSIDELIAPGIIKVELSNVVVDQDKCILCLTCIRSCPSRAMIINSEKGCAQSIAEVCQKCGICVGECPAKAIVLPGYEDTKILESADDAGNY